MGGMAHSLRLIEEVFEPGGAHANALGACPRIVYVVDGGLEVAGERAPVRLEAGAAWHGSGPLAARACDAGARVLRFELVDRPAPPLGDGALVLEHEIALDRREPWIIRCDRVDFEPGGVALPHRHRGGGIRWLLEGQLEVTVGEDPPRTIRPGDAWFESGKEPVLAVSSREVATSFVRVSLLPAEIRGKTSIVYVDPEAAGRSRPRRYTVHVDEPIDLGRGGAGD